MQDWVDAYDIMFRRGTSHSPYHRGVHPVDKSVKICPSCDHVWERFYVSGGNGWESYGKDSMPRIGKKKKICPKCKSKGKANDTNNKRKKEVQ